jgi:hypothetical protein
MFGDPRLGVRFGFERGDPCRITVRDADLDTERPALKQEYAVARLGVGMRSGHFHARN